MARKSLHDYRRNDIYLVPKADTFWELNPPVEGNTSIPIKYLDNRKGKLRFVCSIPNWIAGDGELVLEAWIPSEKVRSGNNGGLVVSLDKDSTITVAGPEKGQNSRFYEFVRKNLK